MKTETSRLIELVKDKMLLMEAPLLRDLIVQLYNFDIDDKVNSLEKLDRRWEAMRKFRSLVWNLREKSGPLLYEMPKYDFRVVLDENKVRCVVHIKEGVNEDYILEKVRYGKRMRVEDWEEEMERWAITGLDTYEGRVNRANSWADSHIGFKKRTLVKNYCKRKHIKLAIKELRHPWVQTKLTDIFSSSSNSNSSSNSSSTKASRQSHKQHQAGK